MSEFVILSNEKDNAKLFSENDTFRFTEGSPRKPNIEGLHQYEAKFS